MTVLTYGVKKYKPNFEKLKELLVNEYNFNETRVEKGISRLKKARSISGQKKIDSFFT